MLWREESRFGFIFSLTLTKKGHFSQLFSWLFFGSFSAIELLYRTRLWAPHIKHDLSNLVKDPCIVLWREESRFGLIFSLTLTKKRPFFGLFFGSFSAKELLYRIRLRAPHDRNDASISYEGPYIVISRKESRSRLIFSLTLTKKGLFFSLPRYFFSGYFWLIFGYRTSLPDHTPSPTCQQDVSNLFEGSCIVLWQEESNFGLIFSLSLTKKGHRSLLFFLIFWLIFEIKQLYRTSLRAPHVKDNLSNFFIMPLHRALTEGVSFRINIQPHTHEREPFFTSLFLLFLALFGYRTSQPDRLRAPHVRHNVSNYLKVSV